MNIFRVIRSEETRVEIDDELMGWGFQFPDDSCYVYWNRQAYPPEDRLVQPHVSVYGCLADVEQGTGGSVVVDDYVYKEARK